MDQVQGPLHGYRSAHFGWSKMVDPPARSSPVRGLTVSAVSLQPVPQPRLPSRPPDRLPGVARRQGRAGQ
jgi:hypothetical protein